MIFYRMKPCNACVNCLNNRSPCLQPPRINVSEAMASNLCTVDLIKAPLSGVDTIKGPTINLATCSLQDVYKKIQDVLTCHEYLKSKGLIEITKEPLLHLDIHYKEE